MPPITPYRYTSGRSAGRLKQASKSDKTRHEEATAVVLAQPHRKGDADPLMESAVGRFCKRMKCRKELYDSAIDYLNKRIWWGVAVGRPRGLENVSGRGGSGPSDETVRSWLSDYMSIDRELMRGRRGYERFNLFYRLVVEGIDIEPGEHDQLIVSALHIAAVQSGRMSARVSAFD
jgi:hypothetical protein